MHAVIWIKNSEISNTNEGCWTRQSGKISACFSLINLCFLLLNDLPYHVKQEYCLVVKMIYMYSISLFLLCIPLLTTSKQTQQVIGRTISNQLKHISFINCNWQLMILCSKMSCDVVWVMTNIYNQNSRLKHKERESGSRKKHHFLLLEFLLILLGLTTLLSPKQTHKDLY